MRKRFFAYLRVSMSRKPYAPMQCLSRVHTFAMPCGLLVFVCHPPTFEHPPDFSPSCLAALSSMRFAATISLALLLPRCKRARLPWSAFAAFVLSLADALRYGVRIFQKAFALWCAPCVRFLGEEYPQRPAALPSSLKDAAKVLLFWGLVYGTIKRKNKNKCKKCKPL